MTDNVFPLPTTVERLVAAIKADLKRREVNAKEWIDATYDLCIHLAELRQQFPSNIAFGQACEEHGLGKGVINSDTRAAAVDMGGDPSALTACLLETGRRSIETIYRLEFDRFRSVPKTTRRNADSPKRGKRNPEKLKQGLETLDLFEKEGRPVTAAALAEAAGIGETTAKKAIAAKNLADEAKPEIEPLDPATAAPSVKERMEAWQRAERRRIREALYDEVVAQVAEGYDPMLKRLHEREKIAERKIANHKGLMSKRAYMSVVKCLHPDGQPDHAQKAEAFRLFTELKDVLVKDDEPVSVVPLPLTVADLLARRKTKR